MLRPIFSALCLFILTLSFAQNSENVDSLGRWYQSGLREQSSLTFNDIWGYTDSEMNEYGIIGSVEYTHFIDINDPQNPVQVDQFAASSRSVWRDFKTYLHYAYGVADNSGGALDNSFDLLFLVVENAVCPLRELIYQVAFIW